MSPRGDDQVIDLDRLSAALRASWTADTSVNSATWSPARPAIGQCAVTALVVQDYFGGVLRRAMVGEISHYWNRLPNGAELDLTREQFDEFAPYAMIEVNRSRVLSFPSTLSRYLRLRSAVEDLIYQAERLNQ